MRGFLENTEPRFIRFGLRQRQLWSFWDFKLIAQRMQPPCKEQTKRQQRQRLPCPTPSTATLLIDAENNTKIRPKEELWDAINRFGSGTTRESTQPAVCRQTEQVPEGRSRCRRHFCESRVSEECGSERGKNEISPRSSAGQRTGQTQRLVATIMLGEF